MKQKCFLVCNAHLDPVWLWSWEEGLTEAISTFRVAADFCEQYPGFVFNHNEALLYEWVERNDPKLFRRIQRLVTKGRWHIAGGSYLQPDLIGASGESLIRHFLVGKEYFKKKFAEEPTTAYNFDSFGHPQGFIQILTGCGYDSYVFCRPGRGVLSLPVGSFRWRHASGVEVVARRSDEHYITQGELLNNMKGGDWGGYFRAEGDFMFLWGIGNHGGGPSHDEYADLKKLTAEFPDNEFIESCPEEFFRHSLAARGRDSLPIVRGDFKPAFEGCYTSMHLLKMKHRQTEILMRLTETAAAIAWWRGQHGYPGADLAVAWKDILFSEFHDILPGSGIQRVEEESLGLLGHAQEILRRKKAEIFISRLRNESLAERNETPIFVFNPHGWEVTQEVEIEYGIDRQFALDAVERRILCSGKPVAAQFEKAEENLLNESWGEWRKRAVFLATIPALSHQRFETGYTVLPPGQIVRWKSPVLPKSRLFSIETEQLRVAINLKTGLLEQVDCGGETILAKASCLPVIFEDLCHSWTTMPKWQQPAARFELASPRQAVKIIGSQHTHRHFPEGKPPVSILEDGPIRLVVEAVFVSGNSFVVQRYVISKKIPVLRIEQDIFWTEHDRKLCLEFNHNPKLDRVQAEKCYSIDDEQPLAAAGHEMDFQHFLRFSQRRGDQAFAVVSHGTHAYSHLRNKVRLNILRSPGYATHVEHISPETDRYLNRYIPRQDQGSRTARFTFLFGDRAATTDSATRGAYEASLPLEPFVYFPTNRKNPAPFRSSFAAVSAANVVIVAIKKAESGDDLVIRLWETAGRKTACTLTVEEKRFPIVIGSWQLQTLRLDKSGGMTETNLIESSTRDEWRP